MTSPLVSVVLPAHNRAAVLTRSVNSVLGQTYAQLELIVVDDGSKDETRDVLHSLQTRDDRVRIISLTESGGAARARNVGWQAAKGEWIAFQDSDDEWVPDKLERQMEAGLSSDQDRVHFARYRYITPAEQTVFPLDSAEALEGRLHRRLLDGNVLSLQTTLITPRVLQAVGGLDERLRRFQDWDLALRVSRGASFHFVDAPLADVFADRPDRISLQDDVFMQSASRVVANQAELGARRADLARLTAALARQALASGQPALERELRWRAARLWPSPRAIAAFVRAAARRHAHLVRPA